VPARSSSLLGFGGLDGIGLFAVLVVAMVLVFGRILICAGPLYHP
jgi:hypothetical protein